MFCITSITSTTGAYYSSTAKNESIIQAGTWWDGSFLEFIDKPTQNVKACPKIEISVRVKNSGLSMIGSTSYNVYYTTEGQPKENGELKAERELGPVSSGETTLLTFNAEEAGFYMFKLNQRPGFEEKNKKYQENRDWSEKVHVNCKAANSNDKEQLVDEPTIDDSKDIEGNNDGTDTIPSEDSQSQNKDQKSEENPIENTESNTDQEVDEVKETDNLQKEIVTEEVVENKEG